MKLNNKGFAISTVVYGLSIMGIILISIVMATMSTNRSNTRQLAKDIEEDLNRHSKTETTFRAHSTTPSEQQYIVPEGESGWYRIELWGAQGGGANGGLGGYTSGLIKLNEGESLYFYLGKHGSSDGGKETDVRIVNGEYNDPASYKTRIMVAGAGGESSGASGGTLYGYNNKMTSKDGYLNTGSTNTFDLKGADSNSNGSLIGQPSDYNSSIDINVIVNKYSTISGLTGSSGGGDGYIPGESGYGGSSFISGYAGVRAYNGNSIDSSKVTYTYQKVTYDDDGNVASTTPVEYRFIDGYMIAGVNSGDGKAKIERVIPNTNAIPTQNSVFKSNTGTITHVRDCLDTSVVQNDFKRLEIVYNGGKVFTTTSGSSVTTIKTVANQNQKCRVYTLPSGTITGANIEELAVWHIPGKKYINNTIFVSYNNQSSWVPIKSVAQVNGAGAVYQIPAETETINGIRISAYQYNSTTAIPENGTYYIIPVLSENKILSAPATAESSSNAVEIEYIQGLSRQKWSIEKITNTNITPAGSTEYKIVELARHNALAIAHDENDLKEEINAETEFNNYARNEPQIWNIYPASNGTYIIKTAVPEKDFNTGMIFPATHYTDFNNKLIIGNNKVETMRFKLIALEYNT